MDKTSCKNEKLILLCLFLFSSCLAEMADPSIQFSRPSAHEVRATNSNDRYSSEEKSNFYQEYIAKYYPKAYVIQEKFLKMTVDQVATALNDVNYVFVKDPWFYFQNTPKGFRLVYFWEYIIDQLSILHNFLVNARVDKKTKKVFLPNNKSRYNFWSNFSSFAADKNSTQLADYLKENFVKVYADFYALSYDYHVKMFNEGILLKKMPQANRYINELEYISEKLNGTPREADYTEATGFCKEVLAILKKKMGYDNYVSAFGSDANAKAL
jgi:hypothetical protein